MGAWGSGIFENDAALDMVASIARVAIHELESYCEESQLRDLHRAAGEGVSDRRVLPRRDLRDRESKQDRPDDGSREAPFCGPM